MNITRRQLPSWTRHLLYRRESIRTTWKLRLGVLLVLGLSVALSRGIWVPAIGNSLVCAESVGHPDALLLDNLDSDYLLFEQASTLRRERPELQVFVPVAASPDGTPSGVQKETADVMARISRLPEPEPVVFEEIEPISLNVAYKVRARLRERHISSVAIVSPAFRSRRSALVYDRVLGKAGIRSSCVPVFGTKNPDNWADTWHGVQEVVLQFLKLQYYRLWILPNA